LVVHKDQKVFPQLIQNTAAMIKHKPHNIQDTSTITELVWAMHIHTNACHTGLSTIHQGWTGGDINHYTAMLSILWQAVPQQKVSCTVQTVNVYTVSRFHFTLPTLQYSHV
jgi:hypothetical protein